MTEREILRNTPTGPVFKRVIATQRLPPHKQLGRVQDRFPRKFLTTTGYIAKDGTAYVYAAGTRDGLIKIGMTARKNQRIANLNARLIFAVEVVHAAAKEIETHALRLLGHGPGDGEYVARITPSEATFAVKEAFRLVGGYRHVDPAMTEEEARKARIKAVESA
jgi:hypothetical protein